MNDLIYGDYKAEEIVKKRYPNIKIEDASDEIHRERFCAMFEDDEFDENEYLKFLLESGLSQISLQFQIASRSKDEIPKIRKALNELKKEKPELFKK